MAQDISSASSVSSIQNLDQDYNLRQQNQDRVGNKNEQGGHEDLTRPSILALRTGRTQRSAEGSNPLEDKLQFLEKNLGKQAQEESEETQEIMEDIRQSLNITLEPINIKLDYS